MHDTIDAQQITAPFMGKYPLSRGFKNGMVPVNT